MNNHVDVIIPVRNGELYISQAIQSALDQSYPLLSVTVVDDGSTDRSSDVARSFGPRVRCISTPPHGLSAARNTAIDETQGEYIAFLDADDLWESEKIERQIAFLEAFPEFGLVHTQERRIDEDGRRISIPEDERDFKKPHGKCLLELLRVNTIVVSSVLLRRGALQDLRFDQEMYGAQDYDLWLRLSESTSVGFLDTELTEYRMHGSGMSRANDKMARDLLVIMQQYMDHPQDSVRRLATERWRSVKLGFALRAYAAGDHGKALKLFKDCDFTFSWHDRLRYFASHLPHGFISKARALRQLVCGARAKSLQAAVLA